MEHTFLSKNVIIRTVSENESTGVFELSNLYTGYGVTLGNALRRVLLSSLPGAAVTQIKIKGAKHEFSSLEGVLEDVVNIMLNVKKIRFAFFADESQTLTLKKKGSGEVTAADIKTPSQVVIKNPQAHIATLTSRDAEFDMELTIEKGLGYVPAEFRKTEKLPIGAIALDAIFTPVVNVNFEVSNMRVGDRTDYNKLTLTIETDKTITPSRALHKAANILKDHLQIVSEIVVTDVEGAVSSEGEVAKESPKGGEKEPKETKKKTSKSKK
ncbi:MAG: DNA-directed RNA polymerase subunit alpha [Patescibacteria group bacterium]|nr:DNA-directed RNA polymerase subunit alpha [Patescibacteria group bacterium]